MNRLWIILSFGVIAYVCQDVVFPDDYEIYNRFEETGSTPGTLQQSFKFDDFIKSNELLAADLYRELRKVNSGNFLICPYSLHIIFSFVHAGAREKTSREIAKALHIPDDTTKIQDIIRNISLNVFNQYTLTNVNKVYLANRFRINNNFKNIAQNVFKADIENVDFSQNEEAAHKINQWVQTETKNTIKDLIDKEYLDANVVSVMINALYFNADWMEPFDSMYTRTLNFFVSAEKKVDVEMMICSQYSYWYNNEALDATFLELPYQGYEVTMTVVLPNKIDGLSLLERNIEKVLELQPLTQSQSEFTISLPKFKMETSILLKEIFQNLGIKDAFTRNANFSGMTAVAEHNIFISHAIQKNFIQVTEKGTTAGAATGVGKSSLFCFFCL
ncbi:hypothetical protein FQR65_LT06473 [Abscondita terminalis]|nr:hypothetical protein FQR65_LT06473 [Abscondita terminalis]